MDKADSPYVPERRPGVKLLLDGRQQVGIQFASSLLRGILPCRDKPRIVQRSVRGDAFRRVNRETAFDEIASCRTGARRAQHSAGDVRVPSEEGRGRCEGPYAVRGQQSERERGNWRLAAK